MGVHYAWQHGIRFNDAEEPAAYGLRLEEADPKPFLMCLQALFLRNLLFSDIDTSVLEKKEAGTRSYMYVYWFKQEHLFSRELNQAKFPTLKGGLRTWCPLDHTLTPPKMSSFVCENNS